MSCAEGTLASAQANGHHAMITLVLLPGMDGTGELFAPFVSELGSDFDVKIVRYPPTGGMGYAELESIAHAALPVDGPFVLLGESFSGPIAISLAASRPLHLKGLVLCCTFARNPLPLFAALRPLIGAVPVSAIPVGVMARLLLGSFSTAALRSAFAQAVTKVSPGAFRARLRSVLSVDVSKQLCATVVPTMYLRAIHDRAVPAAASKLISQLKPSTRVVAIDAPHFLLQAAPAEAAVAIRQFVGDIERSAWPVHHP